MESPFTAGPSGLCAAWASNPGTGTVPAPDRFADSSLKLEHAGVRAALRRMSPLALTVALVLLASCGGGDAGGGGGAPSRRAALPELSQDITPSGSRIDVASRNFFAFSAGDRAEYRATTALGQPVLVLREVVTGPDAQARVSVRESVPLRPDLPASVENYQRLPQGLYELDFWGPSASPGLRSSVPDLLLYPTPFYPAGAIRTIVRQGNLGADLDGDMLFESFRFEFEQVFVGFETGTRGGRIEQRARFRNRILLRIEPSRLDRLPVDSVFTEEVVFAEQTGIISASLTANVGGSNAADYNGLEALVGGTLAGRSIEKAWNAGRTRYVALKHHDLAYDPVGAAYYAGTSALDSTWPGRVVRIDPNTGAMQVSAALGNDVRSIAVAADGQSIYAGVYNRAEIVRLSLPDLRLLQTITLPPGSWAFSLAVSPVDSNTVAYYGDNFGGPRLVRNGVHQTATPGNFGLRAETTSLPSRFSADGSHWFLFGLAASGSTGLLKVPVLSSGLGSPNPATSVFSRSLDISDAGVVAGTGLYDSATLALVGSVLAPDLTDCRPLRATSRWVCRSSSSGGFRRVGVVDTASFNLVPDGLVPYDNPPSGAYSGGPTVRVVPGPPGQVAIMVGGEAAWYGDWIGLFDNPDFR